MTALKRTLALFAALAMGASAHAHTVTAGSIAVDHPWSRATRGPVGAVYLVIRNEGSTDDRLIAASSDVAESVEIHEHAMSDGVMRMRPAAGGVTVSAGDAAVFEPGGLHIMLIGLKAPLVEEEAFSITLTFEKAGDIAMDVDVLPADAAGGEDHHDHDGHGGHGGHGGL